MKVFAVISDHRVHKSSSPVMHNAVIAGRKLQNDYNYVALEIGEGDLGTAMAGFRAMNIAGANVTMPYKESIMEYMDEVSENAQIAGAVNTVIREGDKLIGDNSDIGGFIDSLEVNGINPANKNVCIVGNGGAARGLIVGLKGAGAGKITIAGRSIEKAKKLADEFDIRYTSIQELSEMQDCLEILVNASAVSTREESPEFSEILAGLTLPKLECVVDINYGRENTLWEQLATSTKSTFVNGLPMLALQARISFRMWTGIDVKKTEYLNALGIDII